MLSSIIYTSAQHRRLLLPAAVAAANIPANSQYTIINMHAVISSPYLHVAPAASLHYVPRTRQWRVQHASPASQAMVTMAMHGV